MPAKLNVPASSEVAPTVAMIKAARRDGKEEWESDSGAKFHMLTYTRAGMTAYKKASQGVTVVVADGNILSVDGFRTVETDVDQPGTKTKPVKVVTVAYVRRLSRNFLSTHKAEDHWGKQLFYYNMKAVLGFPGKEPFVFNCCFRKVLFSATGVRRTPSQGAALALAAKPAQAMGIAATGQRGFCEARLKAEAKRKVVQ